LKVLDPAPYETNFGPKEGDRFVAIKLRVRNTGSTVYGDCPPKGAALVDAHDQKGTDQPIGLALSPQFLCLNFRPGYRYVAYVNFEVPKRSKLRTCQHGPDSGFGPQAGEWALR
jgi:hypothetical protein